MNAWPPQASYPCGNISDGDFFKAEIIRIDRPTLLQVYTDIYFNQVYSAYKIGGRSSDQRSERQYPHHARNASNTCKMVTSRRSWIHISKHSPRCQNVATLQLRKPRHLIRVPSPWRSLDSGSFNPFTKRPLGQGVLNRPLLLGYSKHSFHVAAL